MPNVLIECPSVSDVEAQLLRDIVTILDERRGERTHTELSREIGVSRPMLRMMQLSGSTPGLDTLAALIDWDKDTFLPLVIKHLKLRGNVLRTSRKFT